MTTLPDGAIHMSYWFLIVIGAALGLLCGLLPLILGIVKKKTKLGLIGFVSCFLIGMPLSLLGALPAAIIFAFLILRRKRDLPDDSVNVKI